MLKLFPALIIGMIQREKGVSHNSYECGTETVPVPLVNNVASRHLRG